MDILQKVVDIDVSSGDDSGYGTSIALTESKEVYGWGYSSYGQLGKTGTFTSPIKVSNINTAVEWHLEEQTLYTLHIS